MTGKSFQVNISGSYENRSKTSMLSKVFLTAVSCQWQQSEFQLEMSRDFDVIIITRSGLCVHPKCLKSTGIANSNRWTMATVVIRISTAALIKFFAHKVRRLILGRRLFEGGT